MSYQGIYVDVTDLLEFRKRLNTEKKYAFDCQRLYYQSCPASLCSEVPIMNSAFNEDMTEIQLYESCNISVMTASERGLVAPVVKETQAKSIFQISDEMKVLIEKANQGKLMPEDYADGTFGITNIGKLNSFDSVPLPMPPEPAIMTACTAKKMPVVLEDGNDTIRSTDDDEAGHRRRSPYPPQGVPLAQFINSMKELLEDPASLVD